MPDGPRYFCMLIIIAVDLVRRSAGGGFGLDKLGKEQSLSACLEQVTGRLHCPHRNVRFRPRMYCRVFMNDGWTMGLKRLNVVVNDPQNSSNRAAVSFRSSHAAPAMESFPPGELSWRHSAKIRLHLSCALVAQQFRCFLQPIGTGRCRVGIKCFLLYCIINFNPLTAVSCHSSS